MISSVQAVSPKSKTVGKRGSPRTPAESLRRAQVLQEQANLMNPIPRPRGFVFKARTRADYEQWRRSQANPRLW